MRARVSWCVYVEVYYAAHEGQTVQSRILLTKQHSGGNERQLLVAMNAMRQVRYKGRAEELAASGRW